MKRFLVLAAWILLASATWGWAENACDCGGNADPKGKEAYGALACPLFEVDVDYWYCDYYEIDCNSTPTVCYLDGPYSPVWECGNYCQSATFMKAQKHVGETAERKKFDPEHTEQNPIQHGPGAGKKPAPKMLDVVYQGKKLVVSFEHPMDPRKTVLAEVKRIPWGLVNPATARSVPSHGTKNRFAALEVAQASDPEPIGTFGYKVCKRSITGPPVPGTPGKKVCSVTLEPVEPKPNPFSSLALLVWLTDSLPPDCGQP